MRLRPILAYLACLVLSLACGGDGGFSLGSGTPTGNLTVRLGSDSFPGYNKVVLGIEKLEGSPDGTTWTLLGNVKSAVDLMLLQNGNSAAIVSAASAPAATYTQFRITWATVDYYDSGTWPSFVSINGNPTQLAMPATTVLSGSVKVTASSTTVLLMLSGQQAVQSRLGGLSLYTFQATGSAYDPSAMGRLTGHLAGDSTPLTGVEVYAETVDTNGLARIQRRAFTDGSGNYALEGLTAGSQYYVVAQPGNAYQAQASAAVSAAAATTNTADLAFNSALSPSHYLNLIVTPPSTLTQCTWGELRQLLPTGNVGSKSLIVRSQTLDTAQSQDSTYFYGLCPGAYDFAAQRSTSGAAPIMKAATLPVTVNSGSYSTASLTFP